MTNCRLDLELATWRKTEVYFIKHAAGDPAVLGHASDRGESHPRCAANHVKDGGYHFYSADTLNIGLKVVSHLGLGVGTLLAYAGRGGGRDRRMQAWSDKSG